MSDGSGRLLEWFWCLSFVVTPNRKNVRVLAMSGKSVENVATEEGYGV